MHEPLGPRGSPAGDDRRRPSRPRTPFPDTEPETYDYDRRGRLQAKTTWSFVDDLATAVTLTTRYTWDMDDRLRSAELPRGSTIGIAYDGLGRPALLTDQHGTTRESRYDAAGDLHEVAIIEHEGGVSHHASWTYEYDARRRLRAIDGASGRTEFEYDDRDEVVERREPGAVTIRSATNQYGELTESLLDPGGLTIRSTWNYDDAGRLAAYIDPTGATTTWEYDRLGRLRTHTLPDGSKWRHDFDIAAGRVENIAPSGTRVSHVLDANNLPIRRDRQVIDEDVPAFVELESGGPPPWTGRTDAGLCRAGTRALWVPETFVHVMRPGNIR